jgi:hypothetical protein
MSIHCVSGFRLLGLSLVLSLTVGHGAYAASSCPGDDNHNGVVTIDEIILAVNAALNGCTGPAQSCGLLRTGQTECDQGAGTLKKVCPGSPPGQDGAVQAGVALSYTDNGDGTITDNATGLTWEKQSSDGTIHDESNTYTWEEAFTRKIAALNTPSSCFAGHCDWRLPNRRELDSLVDTGRFAPAVNPLFYNATTCTPECTVKTCSCTQFDGIYYWSSTSQQDPGSPNFAWAVDFNQGVIEYYDKTLPLYARAVRGGL